MRSNKEELKMKYSEELIRDLYITQDLNKDEVAERLGIKIYALSTLFKEYNIKKPMSAIVARRKCTSIEKYGVDNPSKSSLVKSKISEKNKQVADTIVKKGKQTKLERYGSSTYNNVEKCIETKRVRHGDSHYNNREKYKETMLKNYGVDNWFRLESSIKANTDNVLERMDYSETFKSLFNDRELSIEFLKDKNYTYFDLMKILDIPYYTVQVWVTRLDLKVYINFNFEGKSHYEDEICEFLTNELKLDNILRHDRKVLCGQEVDIYIPEKNVAIEFNGNYWHSYDMISNKLYHFNKSYACEQRGIRLIHVYEYQWQDDIKREILKSIIRNAVGKNDNIIYARKCQIKELSKKDVEEFSRLNSLHGHRNASIYLGLFYNDELVELMSFGKAFFSRDDSIDYECIRSITKLNTTVVGGMNKLFKHFITNYNPNKILYYVDYNTHNGNSMSNLGFEFISYSKYGMVNVSNCKETIHKYGLIFGRKPDKHKEIQEYIKEGKVLTIYDSGVKKYIWSKDNNG